jgi:hypothetical protein
MKKKKALFFIFVCCLFFAFAATQAKTNKEDGSDSLRRAVYFELGGKFFPSLNIDFRRNKQFAWGMGLGIWRDEEENPQTLFIPSLSAYRFFGRRARLEVGGGIGAFVGTYSGLASGVGVVWALVCSRPLSCSSQPFTRGICLVAAVTC